MAEQEMNPAAAKFISSLVKSLQMLCTRHVDFHESIELVGHINVRVDNKYKFDYIVDEQVSKEGEDSVTTFLSNSYHSCPPFRQSNSSDELDKDVMFSDLLQSFFGQSPQSKVQDTLSTSHMRSPNRRGSQADQIAHQLEDGESNACRFIPAYSNLPPNYCQHFIPKHICMICRMEDTKSASIVDDAGPSCVSEAEDRTDGPSRVSEAEDRTDGPSRVSEAEDRTDGPSRVSEAEDRTDGPSRVSEAEDRTDGPSRVSEAEDRTDKQDAHAKVCQHFKPTVFCMICRASTADSGANTKSASAVDDAGPSKESEDRTDNQDAHAKVCQHFKPTVFCMICRASTADSGANTKSASAVDDAGPSKESEDRTDNQDTMQPISCGTHLLSMQASTSQQTGHQERNPPLKRKWEDTDGGTDDDRSGVKVSRGQPPIDGGNQEREKSPPRKPRKLTVEQFNNDETFREYSKAIENLLKCLEDLVRGLSSAETEFLKTNNEEKAVTKADIRRQAEAARNIKDLHQSLQTEVNRTLQNASNRCKHYELYLAEKPLVFIQNELCDST